jgi:ribosome-binding protein aMBF1 (putative translation factor)
MIAEQHQAHVTVAKLRRQGLLVSTPCELCGSEPTEAHHDDYGKPEEVRWLCSIHHAYADSARRRRLGLRRVAVPEFARNTDRTVRKIRAARKARGWSQMELAVRAGMTQPDLSAIEHGKRAFPAYLQRIARVLKLKPEELTEAVA